jgi:hypothetical protein
MNLSSVFIKNLSMALRKTLSVGAVNRELVVVSEFQRAIGKTTALLNFAEDHNFIVVVKSRGIAHLKAVVRIVSQDEALRLPEGTKVVVDEGVDVNALKHSGLDVVTGYTTKYLNK